MATVNLGRIKPVFKGTWSNSTAYTVDDFVVHSNECYIAIQAGSNQNPASASSYWTKIAAKGADGTDGTNVATTLTTQGDILYRDGSGIQRLGAGTNGQALITGGTGANPSWGTLGSDVVKLSDINISGASTASVDGFFTSDYKVYEIIIHHLQAASWLKTRLNVGGSADSNSYYSNFNDYVKIGSSSGHGTWGTNADTSWYGPTYWGTQANPYGYFRMIVVDPLNTSRHKIMYMPEQYEHGNSTIMYMSYGGGRWASNTAISGVTFMVENGGNFTTFKGAIYGYKQSV